MDIECTTIQWYKMDSSRASKFCMHLLCNFYFDEWKKQCEFVKLGYKDVMISQNTMGNNIIDGAIYSDGGRAKRLLGSTKFGIQSYFTPLSMQIS